MLIQAPHTNRTKFRLQFNYAYVMLNQRRVGRGRMGAKVELLFAHRTAANQVQTQTPAHHPLHKVQRALDTFMSCFLAIKCLFSPLQLL